MQYAQVIVNRRLSHLTFLTYAIPEQLLAHIGVGSYVLVSLNNRPIGAIIVQFIKNIPDTLHTQSILKVVSSGPVVTHAHIRAYSEIAAATLSSPSDVYFNFLPPILKSLPLSLREHRPLINVNDGTCHVFQGTTYERFQKYRTLCISPSTSLLFIFPDYNILDQFTQEIHDIAHRVYDSRVSTSKRWEMWQKVHNEKGIYVTTRVGIGIFPVHATHIVVDNPAHPGFKEDRRPRYQIQECLHAHQKLGHTVTVGVHYASSVISFLIPTVQKQKKVPLLITQSKEIIPSLTLERIARSKRVLIVVPHKNEWGMLICKDCKTIVRCEHCGRVARQIDTRTIMCPICVVHINSDGKCHHCQSTRIHRYSIGVGGLARIFKKRFPHRIIERVDSGDIDVSRLNAYDNILIIATHKICDFPMRQFDHIVCLGFDPLLDIPSPIQEEKMVIVLATYLQTGIRGEIITSRPLHRVYHALASDRVESFLHTLIQERGDTHPPLSRYIELQSKITLSDSVLKTYPGQVVRCEITPTRTTVLLSLKRSMWHKGVEWQKTLSPSIRVDPDPRIYIV